jgi:probable phosphoglycerate mutase
MRLDVIRHGITALNLDGRFNTEDEPLVDYEVRRLRTASIPTGRYKRVYVSPLRRCTETADALGLAGYQLDSRLCERRFGAFEGLTYPECKKRFGDAFEAFSLYDSEFAPEGGESRSNHFSRVSAWLQYACQAETDAVLAITHGGTLDFLYRLAKRESLHGGERIYAGENAAISSFNITWPQVQLLRFSVPLVGGPARPAIVVS